MYGNNQGLDFLVVVYISIGTIRNCYKKQNLKYKYINMYKLQLR